jgi:hypothetical protein
MHGGISTSKPRAWNRRLIGEKRLADDLFCRFLSL